MELTPSEKSALLKEEYFKLQDQYEDYDRRTLTIKGWVASGSIAALALSYSDSHDKTVFVSISVLMISSSFWYLEAKWKLFQYALRHRIRSIEAYFKGEEDKLENGPIFPLQMYSQFFFAYRKELKLYKSDQRASGAVSLWQVARQGFVSMPYLALMALSLVTLTQRMWSFF